MEKEVKRVSHLMNIQEAAEYLGLTVGTMYQWRSQHKVPYIKVGRKVKFKKDQLDQWLATRTVQPAIEPTVNK